MNVMLRTWYVIVFKILIVIDPFRLICPLRSQSKVLYRGRYFRVMSLYTEMFYNWLTCWQVQVASVGLFMSQLALRDICLSYWNFMRPLVIRFFLFPFWQVADIRTLLPLGYVASVRKSCIGCAHLWHKTSHPKFYWFRLSRKSIILTRLIWKRWLSIWCRNGNIWDISCRPVGNMLETVAVHSRCLVTVDLSVLISGAESYFIRRRNQHVSVQLLPRSTSTLHPSSPFSLTDASSPPPQSPRGGFPNPLRLKRQSLAAIKCNIVWLLGALACYSHFTLFSKRMY